MTEVEALQEAMGWVVEQVVPGPVGRRLAGHIRDSLIENGMVLRERRLLRDETESKQPRSIWQRLFSGHRRNAAGSD